MVLTCKQGKHDFRPSSLPLPIRAKRLYFRFWLLNNCWYDNLGADNEDINKGPGIYRYFDFKKNKNSLIAGWKPKLDEPGVFRITPYENRNGAIVANEHLTRLLKAEESLEGYFEPASDGWALWLMNEQGQYFLWHKSALIADCVGKIDGWFGGNQTAPHTMHMSLRFWN